MLKTAFSLIAISENLSTKYVTNSTSLDPMPVRMNIAKKRGSLPLRCHTRPGNEGFFQNVPTGDFPTHDQTVHSIASC
jgi:hypothetical protein